MLTELTDCTSLMWSVFPLLSRSTGNRHMLPMSNRREQYVVGRRRHSNALPHRSATSSYSQCAHLSFIEPRGIDLTRWRKPASNGLITKAADACWAISELLFNSQAPMESRRPVAMMSIPSMFATLWDSSSARRPSPTMKTTMKTMSIVALHADVAVCVNEYVEVVEGENVMCKK